MPWGVAAAGVAAAGSVYSANKNANTVSQSQQQSPQVQAATNQALSQGEAIGNQPFQPYTGSVVAPLSSNQQAGITAASSGYAPAAQDFSTAASNLGNVKDYTASNLAQYMNPYVGATLTPTLTQANVQYQQAQASLLNSKAGAFGGDRSALQAGQNQYNYEQTTQADVANAYSNAYTNAQTAFFNDQNKTIAAANALAGVGNDVSKLNTDQFQALMSSGGVQQAVSQAQLDFDYNQFEQSQNWDIRDLQPLLNSIATAKGVSQSSTTTGPQSGIAGEAIGAAATIAGMYFTGGQSTAQSPVGASDLANYQQEEQDILSSLDTSMPSSALAGGG